ncbi:integrase [Synergistales bacterium]|nr:integrase [Synergistales bacterium]
MKFTQTNIQSLEYVVQRVKLYDDTCKGLYVLVGKESKTFFLAYRDTSGKSLTRKLGDTAVLTVAQAREMAIELKAKLIKGEDIAPKKREPDNDLTVGAFIDIYEPERVRSHKRGDATVNGIRAAFRAFLPRKINELSAKDFLTWRNERLDAGVKKPTVNKNIVALRAALKWGIENKVITFNPLEGFRVLKEDDAKEIVRYLSHAERERLFAALVSRETEMRTARERHNSWLEERGEAKLPPLDGEFADYLRPLVTLALNSGLRRGSLFALQWRDIDIDARVITVERSKSKSGKKLEAPMNTTAFNTLKAWREQSDRTKPNDYVFASPKTGGKLDNINTSWENLLKAADIEDFRFHDCRHDYASRLAMKDVPLNNIRALLGHASMSTTLKYAHLSTEALHAAVETLDEKDNIISIKEATA